MKYSKETYSSEEIEFINLADLLYKQRLLSGFEFYVIKDQLLSHKNMPEHVKHKLILMKLTL